MKQIKYILFALACTLGLSSCMDGDWSNPVTEETQNVFGNQYLTETNVITIAQLKSQYASVIEGGAYEQVTKSIQIKGIVTGNDIEGNIYNEIALQDESGAILVCIAQGGLYGYLPVGQEILIELQGLYIGGYGMQAEIGTLYTSASGSTYVSRMSRATWNNHFKILSSGNQVTPLEVTNINKLDFSKDAGKLITLRHVKIQEANGKAVYAPTDGSVSLTANCANRSFEGISNRTLVLRTSTYSDFANAIMPEGYVDVTGIATRYNNTWQILLRQVSDVQTSTYVPEDVPTVDPAGSGTATDPYNVTAAIQKASTLSADDAGIEMVVKGYVSKIDDIDTSGTYGNATYYISDDKDGDVNALEVYRGYGLNGQKFNAAGATVIKEGDLVVVSGTVVNFSGTTLEFTTGSKLLSINGEGGNDTPDEPDTPDTPTGDSNVTVNVNGTVLTLVNNDVTASGTTITADLNEQGWEDKAAVTTATLSDGTTITFAKGDGTTAPAYYANTKGVRIYAKNTIAITGASKPIAKVVITCDSYSGTDYVGNSMLYGTASGNTLTIVNDNTEAKGGVQLRAQTIEITYAN
ncbi:MAG: hypothetical protein IJ527_06215 [Prevotella sp.]|nr:hypothetical protein [Prevotella sp.]